MKLLFINKDIFKLYKNPVQKEKFFYIYSIDIDKYQILRIKISIIKYYKFLCTRRYIYNTNMKNHD